MNKNYKRHLSIQKSLIKMEMQFNLKFVNLKKNLIFMMKNSMLLEKKIKYILKKSILQSKKNKDR
jgi:hypothetical protein